MAAHETDLERGACMDLLVKTPKKKSEAACDGSVQRSQVQDAATDRVTLQHRPVCDGDGEYEFPTVRHYVSQYWYDADRKVKS